MFSTNFDYSRYSKAIVIVFNKYDKPIGFLLYNKDNKLYFKNNPYSVIKYNTQYYDSLKEYLDKNPTYLIKAITF